MRRVSGSTRGTVAKAPGKRSDGALRGRGHAGKGGMTSSDGHNKISSALGETFKRKQQANSCNKKYSHTGFENRSNAGNYAALSIFPVPSKKLMKER